SSFHNTQDLCPYIHNIQAVAGTIVAIEFHFSEKRRYKMVLIYLPSDRPSIRKKTEKLNNLENKRAGKLVRVPEHLILMWQRGDMQSQIDDFWVEIELALNMGIIELIEPKAITE
ncbi:28007_t:CDS:2, partial [Gigaspora margarita]